MDKKISAIIIYNQDVNKRLFEIAKKSVNWCSETVFVIGKIGNFSDWRNQGLKKAKGDWVLYLDTDEEITNSLKEEILQSIDSDQSAACYAIPRRNMIFGKEFKYSGQYPDYQKRLFRRLAIKKWTGAVHEEPVFTGGMGHLNNPMIHRKEMTISDMLEKTNKWSEYEADLMIKANHPPMNILRFFSAGFREFVLRFIKERCFLDGEKGIIYGMYQIYSRLISYSKLWEKQQSTIHT